MGVDHDTGMVFPMEWKLHDDASYYSGFFKVLSRNTRGEGVQKQVDQGLSVMTDELWKCITRVATERDSPMIPQLSSSSSPQSSSPLPLPLSLKREWKQVDGDDDDDKVNNNNKRRRRSEEPPICSSPTIAVTSPVGVTVVMESSSSPFSPTDCSTSSSYSPLSSPILMFDNDELDVSGALSVLNEVMSCTDEELLPIDPFMSQFLEDHDSFELPSSSSSMPATASPLIGCDSMMNMSQMMMNNVCMTHTPTTITTITPATNTLATLNGVTEDYFVATNSAACAEFDFLLFNNYSFSIEEQPLSEISVSPAVMRPGLSSVVNLSHQSPFFSALEC